MLSVSIPKGVERAAFSHMVPMLRTGAASWPSGDHILLSFARKVFNSLLNNFFLKLRVTLMGDTKELKKSNLPNFRTHGTTSFIGGHLRATLFR